jgi:NADH-quinone oxidoreductase subunit K
MVPLNWYLILSAFLFCSGMYAALGRRNAIAVLMGIELMLNAANINLVAFWRHGVSPTSMVDGQVFALFVIAVAAAEVAVGLALVISIYRNRRTINLDELDILKG